MMELDYFTDAHCHLDDPQFAGDLEEVLARARSAGVGRIVAINTLAGMEGPRRCVELAQRYDWIDAVVGLHPHDAKLLTSALLDELEEMARLPWVVAFGEIGLDFYYDRSPRETQKRAFREQLAAARRVGKPLIIHTRNAESETLAILDEMKGWELGGVFHCFSGGIDLARVVIGKGLYISLAGIITFPRADVAREVAASVPTDRVLIETDAPYLAPAPMRGKRNEPAFIEHTARQYASLRGLTLGDVKRITSFNAARLFRPGFEKTPQIAYRIRNSLYLNITNRCTNSCCFCPKRKDWVVKGYYLKLKGEPSVESVREAVSRYDLTLLDEAVFCGFGEPTLRLPELLKLAKWLKESGARRVRLDTDGLGNLVHGRNIVVELAGCIDSVSVSLNAPDAETYAAVSRSPYGTKAYAAVKDFIAEARGRIADVVATIVGMPGIDVEKCRKIAEEELRVRFRVREYNEVG